MEAGGGLSQAGGAVLAEGQRGLRAQAWRGVDSGSSLAVIQGVRVEGAGRSWEPGRPCANGPGPPARAARRAVGSF